MAAAPMKAHANTRHGQCCGKKSPEYIAWVNLRARCSSNHPSYYPNYKARGICVAPEWDDFERFLADMGPRPSPAHTVEREDNDKGYGPDNCVWATRVVQNNNQRPVRKDSRVGLRGVSVDKRGFYRAEGRGRYLKYTSDFFEACCARKSWESSSKELS